MTHKIKIKGLRVYAHHGVFDFERQNGQDFFIDATIWVSGKARVTDDLNHTVHYGDLAKALVEAAKNQPVDLLETLAQRLLDLTHQESQDHCSQAKRPNPLRLRGRLGDAQGEA
jgi:dihydroneopterin aldolase